MSEVNLNLFSISCMSIHVAGMNLLYDNVAMLYIVFKNVTLPQEVPYLSNSEMNNYISTSRTVPMTLMTSSMTIALATVQVSITGMFSGQQEVVCY